ncbi:MAG: FxsA family protein [Pseudomonadota bacterium]
MWLLLAFILVPLIEITLFIQVGSLIGLWPTLAIVVLTALLGTVLVRTQGLQTLANLRQSMETGADPSRELAHGAMILFAGLLLLTPGFFTDALGFALMIPAVRDALFDRMAHHIVKSSVQFQSFGPRPRAQDSTIIEGEFEEVDPDSVPPRPGSRPSGWTRD